MIQRLDILTTVLFSYSGKNCYLLNSFFQTFKFLNQPTNSWILIIKIQEMMEITQTTTQVIIHSQEFLVVNKMFMIIFKY